jgi:hypothetical protein
MVQGLTRGICIDKETQTLRAWFFPDFGLLLPIGGQIQRKTQEVLKRAG